ncbi:MAG TPA: P-loop NTPase [Myxococcota bacterium]|nr:P-loop NTPase [Myxococcota bacterium]
MISGTREGPQSGAPRLIPFGGGKGGVGKTFVAANLATTLAKAGHRVVAVDGDLEGANLHTALGVTRPRNSVAEYAAEREEDVRKLLEETPIPNLRLIAATRPNLANPQPSHALRVRFVRALRTLDADFVFIDLGAGADSTVMDYFMVCDDGVVVIAPEPTSVENAYAFMRAAFYRRLKLSMISTDVRKVIALAMDERNERGIRTPLDLLREVKTLDTEEAHRFVEVMRAFRPRIIVNDVRSAEDIRLGFSVRSVCRKYFAIDAEYLGYVNHDAAARASVRARRPLVDSDPRSDAAVYLARIARKLIAPRVGACAGAAAGFAQRGEGEQSPTRGPV